MKYQQLIVKILLLLCIALGGWGALLVSYSTFTGKASCPDIFTMYICYLVFGGYLLMLTTQLGILSNVRKKVFYFGWAVVFGFAFIGVFFELLKGDVCPQNSLGLPLCYLSFGLALCIIVLFQLTIKLEYKKAAY